MATLRHRVSGGFYIHKGYPIKRAGFADDMFFTTIQTHPRADNFFEYGGYRDGETIEPEVFYALVLDGDITSPSLARKEITPEIIPSKIVLLVTAITSVSELDYVTHAEGVLKSRYLAQFYAAVKQILPSGNPRVFAAWLCISKHLQDFAYKKECNERYKQC